MDNVDELLERKLGSGREYRNTKLIEIRAGAGEDEKIVEGYASTFDEPYLLYKETGFEIWEKVDRNAFDGCDMSDVIMQYDHVGRVFARTSNKTLRVSTDDHGLKMEADLSGTTIGRQLHEEIAGGYTTKMSFGFHVADDKREIEEDRENNLTKVTRTIMKIDKLYDVSAVSLPANNMTDISARGYCDGVIAEVRAERLRADKIKQQKQKIRILTEVHHEF